MASLAKGYDPGRDYKDRCSSRSVFWLATHEMGHVVFDLYSVPLFGHEEDAADNFAAYIMLQFGKERARRLIAGAAWQFKQYIADYRTKPLVKVQLGDFSSNHGQPEERSLT